MKTVAKCSRYLLFMLLLLLAPTFLTAADWDLSKASIPTDQIRRGGPARDGIPALNAPKFVSAAAAQFVRDEEQVLGVELNGVAKAYPTRILSWHELVNDRYRDLPVLVSW